jgi:hypothetical protein
MCKLRPEIELLSVSEYLAFAPHPHVRCISSAIASRDQSRHRHGSTCVLVDTSDLIPFFNRDFLQIMSDAECLVKSSCKSGCYSRKSSTGKAMQLGLGQTSMRDRCDVW